MRVTCILRCAALADCRAGHRSAAEDDADPRAGTVHALQGLLGGARLSLQAQPSGRVADHEDFGERSAIDVVAGGTVNCTFTMVDVTFTSRFPHFYDGVL